MKKLISLLSVAFLATSVFAIPATAKKMTVTKQAPERVQYSQRSMQFDPITVQPKLQLSRNLDQNAAKPIAGTKRAALDAEQPSAFYYLPTGVFFCGIGNAGSLVGTNIHQLYPAVIGSTLNGHEYWLWPNYTKNATKLGYVTVLDQDYPTDAGYGWTMDQRGNFIDSLAALEFGPGLSKYLYSCLRMPLQIAANDNNDKDYFFLIGPHTERLDTLFGRGMDYIVQAMGGCFNSASSDGMWPFTHAMFETPIAGEGSAMVWNKYEEPVGSDVEHKISYIYGTEPIILPTYDTIYVDETKAEIAKIDTIYNDTLKTMALLSSYPQPMSPLYIKDITVALGKQTYVEDSAKWFWDDIQIDSLALLIITNKGVVASSIATKEDTASMISYPGQQVTFKIQDKDPYGAIIEGITINEPFQVVITGFNRPGNNFGVWSAYSPYTGGNNTAVMDNKGKIRQYAPFDPFIMLNGMYYTLEHALRTPYMFTYPAQYISDTINVNVELDTQYDEWMVVHADGDFEGYVPMLRAVELLYDTITKEYNYNIYAPDWAMVDMGDYDDPVSSTSTLWSAFNAYDLYIWGDASDTSVDAPQVGDEIKLARYGRELIFKVVKVDEPQAINNVIRNVNDNKRYNVLGIEVDEEYKGVVIRNGEKFLQR